MAKKDDRFIRTYRQDSMLTTAEIWIDRETGVNYLMISSGGVNGLTPLLNPGGSPVVTPKFQIPEE